MPDNSLTGDWDNLLRVLSDNPVKKAIDTARRRIGATAASKVQKAIVDGAPGGKKFQPLHEYTIRRKKSTKPLIDSGDLVGAIAWQLSGTEDVFIGVKRGAKHKDSTDIADIAAVHEFGTVIPVTPKMRAYLAAQGLYLRRSTTHIVIPPRSYLRPVLATQEFRQETAAIIKEQLKKELTRRAE